MRLMSCERGAQRGIDPADMIYGGGEAAISPPRHKEKLAEPVFINRFEFHLRPLGVSLSGALGGWVTWVLAWHSTEVGLRRSGTMVLAD